MRTAFFLAGLLSCLGAIAAVIKVEGTDGAAIATAIETTSPGDTVSIPEGAYLIDTALAPKSGTHLVGAGQDKTILRFSGPTPAVFVALVGVENVEVAHMTLDGADNANATQGIRGENAKHLNIHHMTIRNLVKGQEFGPHGILFLGTNPTREHGVTDSVIADCRIRNIGLEARYGGGIRLAWGSSNNKVLRNSVENTGRGGIFADDGSTDNVIGFNTVKGSGGEGLGIEVWGGSDRSVIEHNTIDHWLSIGGCSHCAARHNTISDRSGTYKFSGIEAIGSYIIVTDNTVDGGAQIGLSLSSPHEKSFFLWARNTVRECNQWGAQFQGDSGGLAYHYLYDCTFENTSVGVGPVPYPGDEGHGFRILGNTRHITFEDCAIRNNGRLGLQLNGPNVDALCFRSCAIAGNKGAAVAGPSGYTRLEFESCTVFGNGNDTLPEEKPFETEPPVASFTAPRRAQVGETITLRNTSKDSGPPLAAALWDLGAGLPVFHDLSATESPPPVTTPYDAPGDYRVTLVVWDLEGRASRAEKSVTIAR